MNPIKRLLSMFKQPDDNVTNDIQWNTLSDEQDFQELLERSESTPQILYKHSTICSFSRMAQNELLSASPEIEEKADINYLSVIESRPLSNKVAEKLGIRHESPQVIIIKNRKAVWDTSHSGVRGNNILKHL